MSDQNERLASLEATLMFLKDLLQEIRQDVKDQPSKEEFQKHIDDDKEAEIRLTDKLDKLSKDISDDIIAIKDKQTSSLIKVGIASGIVGIIGGILIKWLLLH